MNWSSKLTLCQAWSGAASVTPARDEAQHIAKEVLGVNRRNNNPV